MNDVLRCFHPAVSQWFSETFSEPTAPQALGWPRIAAGESTLLLAPTGSGKTLAAFLCAIDAAIRDELSADVCTPGVHTLYVSPLKALANDIERNLVQPLCGIRTCGAHMDAPVPEIRVGLRTGDTPTHERRRMIRRPPHILITTPESLHLLLTSVKAREMLRSVRYVIVDEIHAVCSSKRGTFLALLLERLEALVSRPPVRIGLSATQRPLSEVARFLGGQDAYGSPRPVAVVDAGMRKDLDLLIESPAEDMTALPQLGEQAPSIWPAIYERLIELVDEHESTLIFANSRRVVERIASEMNRRIGYERVQAHHGSISREKRHDIEQALKEGRLPALVATSSMELGIDVGFVDLVCHVESPFSVASGLQRIGRAGHVVRATSKGRLIPKNRPDLLMSAAMSRSMLRGDISGVRIPENPLDVLAQQVVAMVAVDEWDVDALYERIRCAYPYRQLPKEAFLSVLEMISGRFGGAGFDVLRPRVSWDRIGGRVLPLPGTRHVAILNGGVIPDTGQYAMVLEDGKTRLGELDEEFVFERRLGDTFVLGTGQWRILEITNDHVVVTACDPTEAMMPFWKGEGLGHDVEFGAKYGEFVRACGQRLSDPSLEQWLRSECALDETGARNLIAYLKEQKDVGGALPDDRTILIDVFRNEVGDERMALISTYGRAFHMALWLLLQRLLRDRGLDPPEGVFSNAGILLRTGSLTYRTILDVIGTMRSADVKDALARELENSPLFALQFRRNAGCSLLLPRTRAGRRTPLWLQRLRAHDLLAFAGQQAGFPVVLETYRELMQDVLPLDGLRGFLERVEAGDARFAVRRDRRPSPFSNAMMLDFTAKYLYIDDRPVGAGRSVSDIRTELSSLIGDRVQADTVLNEDALATIEERLQGTAPFHRARNGAEVTELLRRIGDLTESELALRCEPDAWACVPDLLKDGRIVRVEVAGSPVRGRWAAGEEAERYDRMDSSDARFLIARYVAHHAIIRTGDIVERYPVDETLLEDIRRTEGWIGVDLPDGSRGWSHPQVLASIRRMTMARRRKAVHPVSAETYVRWLLARQHVATPVGADGIEDIVALLSGCALPVPVWHDVLALRIRGYRLEGLEALVRDGVVTWSGVLQGSGQRCLTLSIGHVGPRPRRRVGRDQLDKDRLEILAFLEEHGASFLHQLATGLHSPPSAIAPLLWDLIWAGWVTNDTMEPAWGERPRVERWHDSGRRPLWGRGRWSALPDVKDGSDEGLRVVLREALSRCGVLSREILAQTNAEILWRDAYPLLTRMEWAGEVERAPFLSGLAGPQFALCGAARDFSLDPQQGGLVLLNVNDPANVFGDLFPLWRPNGERYIVRHHPGNYLVLEDGRPILAVENRGERLIPLADLSPLQRISSLRLLPLLVEGRERPASVRIATWDGHPVVPSILEKELADVGFVRDDCGMILYRTYA